MYDCVHVCICLMFAQTMALKCYAALYLLRTQHSNEITRIYYLPISIVLLSKKHTKKQKTKILSELLKWEVWKQGISRTKFPWKVLKKNNLLFSSFRWLLVILGSLTDSSIAASLLMSSCFLPCVSCHLLKSRRLTGVSAYPNPSILTRLYLPWLYF